jgi:hypothetical protein
MLFREDRNFKTYKCLFLFIGERRQNTVYRASFIHRVRIDLAVVVLKEKNILLLPFFNICYETFFRVHAMLFATVSYLRNLGKTGKDFRFS